MEGSGEKPKTFEEIKQEMNDRSRWSKDLTTSGSPQQAATDLRSARQARGHRHRQRIQRIDQGTA